MSKKTVVVVGVVMDELPDLLKLSHAEKDALIRELWPLRSLVTQLLSRVSTLEAQLAKNSRNSSQPPASDGLKKPKSLRQPGQRPPGGQPGHPGKTLKRVAHPDSIVEHGPPPRCGRCGAPLVGQVMGERRQVFDLPQVRIQVTEHRIVQARCACGSVHRGAFPAGITAPTQYGPHLKALVVYLTQHHMLPIQRTAQLLSDLYGIPLSAGAAMGMIREGADRLAPMAERIGAAMQSAPVVGADETGLRVAGKLQWLHTAVTETSTWLGLHPRRGKAAFKSLGILPRLIGILTHDGWPSYRGLTCQHALCNAHHLRELTFVHEVGQQPWAGRMITLLRAAHHETEAAHGQPLPPQRIQAIRAQYEAIVRLGESANPPAPLSGKRGGTHQPFPVNLLRRLRDYADDVLRFTTDPRVPFANNLAEQAIRMPKVKQKVSGCFRTPAGAAAFCTIRSYLATLQKQSDDLLHALVETFQGNTPEPRFT